MKWCVWEYYSSGQEVEYVWGPFDSEQEANDWIPVRLQNLSEHVEGKTEHELEVNQLGDPLNPKKEPE